MQFAQVTPIDVRHDASSAKCTVGAIIVDIIALLAPHGDDEENTGARDQLPPDDSRLVITSDRFNCDPHRKKVVTKNVSVTDLDLTSLPLIGDQTRKTIVCTSRPIGHVRGCDHYGS